MIAALIVREMEDEYNVGFVKQILSLNLVPRKNVTNCGRNDTSLCDFSGAAIAGVYKAAGKSMFSLEALVFGVGQSLCVFIISFFRVLATL
ncbi:hypothetical protein cypCar_00028813 [Cyprinus carpio]|nr:hypothetical protein cypCar_00028813 [Cyprinus carpio]